MAAINLDIGGNTRQLDRDIQKTVNKVYTINLKTKGDQPLGRITGQVNEFNKSLDASNARVIAFGASAGIIFGVQRAFTALVGATIEVQKSLQDINVILNVSAQNLQKFGGELFNIAKNTGQSFQEVAKAATEFSRQGLGVEETLKRTSEALILSRLSGLDAAKSVEALTAAVNSYASQAVTASEVINKFANVDAAFAVSSGDLAEALARVGSSAAQSGVSLNELIAIVTSAQQTTARGGAVIGNSFKTIFTRLQRGKVVDLLESLGISSTDSSGQLKSTIQLLQDLGKVYDTLGAQQQAYVAEQVGGVFQINILKAALADLGKEYSIYNSALNVAAGSTDQAIRRNEELNKTYAAQLNALQENARQLASAAGERLVGPSIDRLVGGSNALLGGINESDGQGFGAVLGKGILDGLGQFIAGPGLALIGGVLLKLFRDLGKFATGSVQQLLGLNTAATQQKDLQTSISQILAKNPQLLELALKGEQGLNTAANSLLASLQKQTVELQKQAAVAQQISTAFVAQAGVRVAGGVPVAPTGRAGKAAGYIPNFAQGDFAREELLASTLGAKNPTAQLSKGTIDGKKFIKNNREVEITGFGSNGDSAVIPTYGKGFIPNFAKEVLPKRTTNKKEIQKRINKESSQYAYLIPSNAKGGNTVPSTERSGFTFPQQPAYTPNIKKASQKSNSLEDKIFNKVIAEAANYTTQLNPPGSTVNENKIRQNFGIIPGAKGALQGAIGSTFEVAIASALDYEAAQRKEGGDFDVRGGVGLQKVKDLFGVPSFKAADFKSSISRGNVKSFRDKIIKELGIIGDFSPEERLANAKEEAKSKLKDNYPILFDKRGKFRTGLKSQERIDSEKKYNKELDTLANNIYKTKYTYASGYIPNFAAIQDAVSRERAAGIPSSQIYLAQEQALTSANPMGLGVFNKKDEPTKGSRKDAIRSKGFARGYIPNFAETPESSAASIGTVAGALASQLGILAITLQGSGREYKESLGEIAKENRANAKITNQLGQKQRQQIVAQERAGKITKEQAKARFAAADPFRASAGQKLGAGARAGGFGLGIAAPILAQTLSQGISQDTKTGRVAATGVGALGNIGAAAATGAVFGPVGAAVGLAAGALLEIPNVVKAFTTKVPELEKSVTKSSTELTKFSDAGSRLLSSSSELTAALSESSPSQEKIAKLTEQYAAALSGLSLEDQDRLKSSQKVGKLEEEYARILSERTKELQGKEAALALQKSAEKTSFFGSRPVAGVAGSENEKLIKSTFKNLLTGGGQDQKALEALQKSASSGVPQLQKLQQRATTDLDAFSGVFDVDFNPINDELKNVLDQIIPESSTKAEQINAILANASEGPESLKNVIEDLIASYGEEEQSIKNIITIGDEKKRLDREELAAKKEAVKATEQIIASLERNIRMAQMAADKNRALAKANSEFQRNTAFADTFSRPSETVGSIVGQDAPLAEAFTLRESIAKIGFDQIGQIENVKSVFVDEINESIKTAFSEGVGETTAKASSEGRAADIQKSNEQILKPLTGEQEKGFDIVQDVLNKTLSGGGDINTEAVLSEISKSLKEAKINDETVQKITAQVRDAGTKGNLEIEKLRNASINEFKTLAKEQTQKILISKIAQAQKFGGGIGEFTDPKESGENLFDKVVQSTKGFDKFQGQQADFRFDYKPGSSEFKYGYGAAQTARQEMAPEYGRAALDLTDQLQAFTGYTPNADGKAVQAGEAGLKEFYDRQVKQLQTIAKDSSTPQIVKDEINAALKEVNKLGGTKNIAKLQVAQKTGALTESGFKEITGKFQNPVLQSLQDQAKLVGTDTPAGQLLAQQIEELQNVTITSQDPTIQAINSGNIVLKQILTAIQNEGTSGVTADSTQAASTDVNKAVQKAQESSSQKNVSPEQLKSDEIARKRRDLGLEYNRANILPESKPSAQQGSSPEQLKSDEIARKRRDLGLEYNRANILPEQPNKAQPAAPSEQSFTQQEAAFSTNTAAITALTGGIQTLNATLSSSQELNKTAGATPVGAGVQTGAQPNVTTTTSAPVNVVVNAQGGSDIAQAVGEAVQNAIPTIIEKVRIAMGEKVPPTLPIKNPKYDAN